MALGLVVALATACGGWLDGPDAERFGSEPRPGGGGGLLGDEDGPEGVDGDTARIVPEGGAGGFDGGGFDAGEDCVCGAASLPRFGVVGAGFGIPRSVFFISPIGFAATCWPDPGGGGGASGLR